MKHKVLSAATVFLFITAGLSLVVAQTREQPAAPMNQSALWEYKTVKIPIGSTSAFDRDLNRMGAEGWELCLFDATRSAWVFKRPQR